MAEKDALGRTGEQLAVEFLVRNGALTLTKLARLRRLAGAWCEAHPLLVGDIRIDAIAVVSPPHEAPIIEHIEAVFA